VLTRVGQTLGAARRQGTRTVQATVPPKVEYELTLLARELRVTLLFLTDWAGRHRVMVAESRAAYDAERLVESLDA
jgi:DNA-binding HxlR family transcriptional regulator